jgi:hypothetical protein
MTNKAELIANQNDLFRKSIGLPIPNRPKGRYVLTQGISALDELTQTETIYRVRHFDNFDEDNNPHGERDLGKLRVNIYDILWKIDYYDENYHYGSEDPSDLSKTRRVLTIMLSCEY